jgi:hypothetical protein
MPGDDPQQFCFRQPGIPRQAERFSLRAQLRHGRWACGAGDGWRGGRRRGDRNLSDRNLRDRNLSDRSLGGRRRLICSLRLVGCWCHDQCDGRSVFNRGHHHGGLVGVLRYGVLCEGILPYGVLRFDSIELHNFDGIGLDNFDGRGRHHCGGRQRLDYVYGVNRYRRTLRIRGRDFFPAGKEAEQHGGISQLFVEDEPHTLRCPQSARYTRPVLRTVSAGPIPESP